MDIKHVMKIKADYSSIEEEILKQLDNMSNQQELFEYLLSIKDSIPLELFGFYLRKYYKMATNHVPKDLIIKLFSGVDRNYLMYDSELIEFEEMPEKITIYRGAHKNEIEPRTSWSIKKYVAEEFSEGKLFKAIINKEEVFMYVTKDSAEYEVVANVTQNYTVL